MEHGSLIWNDITFSLKSKERYNPASFRWRGSGDRKIVSQSHCFQYREREENFYWAQSGYYSRVERNQPRTVKGRTPDATLLNAKIFFANCGSFSKGSSYEGKNRWSLFDYRSGGSKIEPQLRGIISLSVRRVVFVRDNILHLLFNLCCLSKIIRFLYINGLLRVIL